jgi:Putative zinc-finger
MEGQRENGGGAGGSGCVAGEPSPFSLERLSAFADGDLMSSELQSVRVHLEACAACARRAEELGALARAARALDVPEPPPTLWPAIEGALARQGGAEGRGWWATWRLLGVGALAGAAVVMVVVVGLGGRRGGPAPSPAQSAEAQAASPSSEPGDALRPDPLLAEAEQEFARASTVYERSIEKLRVLLAREEPRFSPDERARHAERLARLDEAIARSREAARRSPADSEGHEQLFAAYQQKIAFLAETVHRGGGYPPGTP